MRYKDFKKYRVTPDERFRELLYFGYQYWTWKAKLEEESLIGSPDLSGAPHGSGIGDPTGQAGTASADLNSKVSLIDRCVKDAVEIHSKNAREKYRKGEKYKAGCRRALLKYITTPNCTYNFLKARGYIDCGSQNFYQIRGIFYWLLDQRKG